MTYRVTNISVVYNELVFNVAKFSTGDLMFNGTILCERADPVLLRFTHLQNAHACRVKRPGKTLKNRLKYRKKIRNTPTYKQALANKQTENGVRLCMHSFT